MSETKQNLASEPATDGYVLDDQIGFMLRKAWQRHTAIFSNRMIGGITSTQFAVLAKLREIGPCSQNRLGRLVAIDAATVKGVVDRLYNRDLLETRPDPADARRLIVSLTVAGERFSRQAIECAKPITEETLAPLDAKERAVLLRLLSRLG